MAPSTFALRFGYAGWLLHLKRGGAPGFAEIGRAVARSGQAVSAWAALEEAPTDYRVHAPLAGFLEVSEDWLVKEKGRPPRPELWAVWLAARAGQGSADVALDEQPIMTGVTIPSRVASLLAETRRAAAEATDEPPVRRAAGGRTPPKRPKDRR